MSFRKYTLLSAAAASIALTGPAAFASEDEGTEKLLETINVEGTYLYSDQVLALKSPTPIIDVPQSLSIISADQISEQGFDSLGDLVDYTPGVNTSQGEGHRDAIVFRGVRSTADYFIDGVRDDVWYYRSLYNVQQVEILRGPNALLFGRGGTGGILNRVMKKGQVGDKFNAYQASLDTFGAYTLQFDGNYSTTDNSAFRINAAFESLDNHRDFYDGERIGINPTARFLVGDSTIIDLSYEYADHERFIDRGIPTGAVGRPVEAFQDIVFGDPELNFTQLEAHLLRANVQHSFADNVKGVFSAFYGDYDKLYQNFYASGYDAVNTPNVVTLDGYVDTTQRTNLNLSANLIAEVDWFGLGHTIVTGAELITSDNDNDRFNAFWDQTLDDNEVFVAQRPLALRGGVGTNASGVTTTNSFTTDVNDNTQAEVTVFSAFIQDEIELSEHFDLVLGLRFDQFKIDVTDLVPATPVDRSRTDEEFSPRLGFVYKPQENVSFYASYSQSFLPRSGEQFSSINDTTAALDPDEFVNLEAGVKWDFAEDLSFTAAIFEIEQSSPQPADNDPTTLDVIDSTINGFELQLQGQVTPEWYISAGYSYLDGEQVNRSGPTGLRPRELPENMFSLWNAYQVNEKLGLGLGLVYQDESFINNGNTAVLPSYTRVDAAAFYDVSEDLRLQLNIENLTDELYFPNSHSTHQASVGAPLNARFTVRGRF